MRVGARSKKERDAVMRGVREMRGELPARRDHFGAVRQFRDLGDKGQVARELRAPPEIARSCDPDDFGPRLLEMLFSSPQKLVGLVHMSAALRFAPQFEAAEDFRLQRSAKPLDLLQLSLARGLPQALRRRSARAPGTA